MKVSVNWLKQYLDFELLETKQLVTRIGAQIGAVEETNDVGAKYQGAVVVKVVECTPLENSDHLKLCYVDDNGVTPNVTRRDDGMVQVVCGAPNVTAGVSVVWLPPGVTVPSTYDGEKFVLEARELRGAVSNGMLASAKELAIGDSHEGLLLLDGDVQPGTSFIEAYQLDDQVIDIENKMFTHRPDCFGQLGVAREVAGILGQAFSSPDWYRQDAEVPTGEGLPLQVRNEIPELVPRFMAITLKNVTVGASPIWLQTYLSRVGLRPINNVVDITNYLMMLTGQPLHAYDYDKVAALSDGSEAHIVVRKPVADERIAVLNGKTITAPSEAMIIASDKAAIGLGAIMGGANSETDAQTTNIILEAANFNMYAVRRVSMASGLFTDAGTRFNKGQSPLQNRAALAKAVFMLQELTGAQVAGELIDDNHAAATQPRVTVDTSFINARLGLTLNAQQMSGLLTNVEFTVATEDETLTVQAPFWRTDIEQPEDVVEEIGRLYGYDKLPLELPARTTAPAAVNQLLKLKSAIRTSLARAGANELLTYSFVPGSLLEKVSQKPDEAFKVSNALSPDLQYYRFHALPSLLDKVHANIKAGYDSFALFELNKGHNLHHKDDAEGGVPTEIEFLDLVFASKKPMPGAPFYQARSYLDALAADLGLTLSYVPITEDPHVPVSEPYDYKRSAYVSVTGTDIMLGMVGEFKSSVLKNLKLPAYSAGFTVGPNQLLDAVGQAANTYQPLPRYPKVEQDICYKVASDLAFSELQTVVLEKLEATKPTASRLSVEALDIYQRPDDDAHKQITFRISLANYEKTMTDTEMSELLALVTEVVSSKFSAEVV